MPRNHAVVPMSLDLLRIILDIPAGVDVVWTLEMDSDDRERGMCRLAVDDRTYHQRVINGEVVREWLVEANAT